MTSLPLPHPPLHWREKSRTPPLSCVPHWRRLLVWVRLPGTGPSPQCQMIRVSAESLLARAADGLARIHVVARLHRAALVSSRIWTPDDGAGLSPEGEGRVSGTNFLRSLLRPLCLTRARRVLLEWGFVHSGCIGSATCHHAHHAYDLTGIPCPSSLCFHCVPRWNCSTPAISLT